MTNEVKIKQKYFWFWASKAKALLFFCSPRLSTPPTHSWASDRCSSQDSSLAFPFLFFFFSLQHPIHFEHCRRWIEFVMCFHWLKAGKNSVWCSGVIKMSIFPHGYILERMYRCYFAPRQCPRTKICTPLQPVFFFVNVSLQHVKNTFFMYINK